MITHIFNTDDRKLFELYRLITKRGDDPRNLNPVERANYKHLIGWYEGQTP